MHFIYLPPQCIVKFGAASSAAAMPGARSERTEDMSPAERGELPPVPIEDYFFHSCVLTTEAAEFSYRSFDVDQGTGLSLPVARPVDDYSTTEEDCCCNIL